MQRTVICFIRRTFYRHYISFHRYFHIAVDLLRKLALGTFHAYGVALLHRDAYPIGQADRLFANSGHNHTSVGDTSYQMYANTSPPI